MASPTRFPGGVTNVSKTNALGNFIAPDPTKVHMWFDDFDIYTSTDWTVTTTEAGTGSATEAISDADGGVLLLTNAAGDDDNDFLQLGSETFKFESGKRLWFKSRFKVSDATQSDVVMGLQITDTSPLDVSDGVFFQKDDGDANLDFYVEKDGTQTSSAAVSTLSDNTYVEAAFFYNGIDAVEVFVNNTKVADLATTNLPDDEELTISFGIQNGEAAAKTMSVDYILVAKER